ncbi:AI-2E family transporter [bacterium 1XD21-13]|nr:AI-2E family transporter [bacterium 1XD21-13]
MKDDSFHKYLFISLAGAVGIILCIVFFFTLFRFKQVMEGLGTLRDILMPFIYGAVIAYLLTPVCNFVEVRLNGLLTGRLKVKEERAARFSAAMGIGLSLLFGFFIVYLLLAMVLPQVFVSVRGIVEVLPGNVVKWSDWIQQKLADDEVLANYAEQFINTAYKNMQTWLNTKLLPNMQVIVSGVSAGLISALVAVKNIVIGIFAAAYMMGNRRKFAAQGKKLIYSFAKVPVANGILDEINYINRVFGGFIDGKLLDSLIIGILCFVVMNLLNMPYTMLISVIVGVTNIIPFFGPFIGAIPCALIMLTASPIKCVYFLILILVLQQVDGNFLGPKILGDSTGLSSFWVLFSILLFGGLMGFVGMVIGVPTFAVIYDLIKKYSNWMLRKKKLSTDTSVYEELSSVEPEGEGFRYVHNGEQQE